MMGNGKTVLAAVLCLVLGAAVSGGISGAGSTGGWLVCVAQAGTSSWQAADASASAVTLAQLPREAVNTLKLVAAGGPYPYAKDGIVFGNYERALPCHQHGYYHEYTVPAPRARNRGARRIVCGGPLRRINNCFYTDDHYTSFRRIVQ